MFGIKMKPEVDMDIDRESRCEQFSSVSYIEFGIFTHLSAHMVINLGLMEFTSSGSL